MVLGRRWSRLNRLLSSWSAYIGYVPAGRPIRPSIIMSVIASGASSLDGTKCKGAALDGSAMRKSSGDVACSGTNASRLDRRDSPSWSLSAEPHISPLGNKRTRMVGDAGHS